MKQQMDTAWRTTGALAIAVLALGLVVPASAVAKPPNSAKLELEDVGCPTQFDAPSCADGVLTIGGTLGISNSGAHAGQVSSLGVILEERDVGNGDSFGPGAEDYRFVGASTVSHYTACNTDGVAPTCYAQGSVVHSAGTSATYSPAAPPLPSVAGSACEQLQFSVDFDLAVLALASGDAARANLVVSFDPARGKSSCDLDHDCDGADATASATVQVTDAFSVPPCDGSEPGGDDDGDYEGSVILSEMSNDPNKAPASDLNATLHISVASNELTIMVDNMTDELSAQLYDISAFNLNHSSAVSNVRLTSFPSADAGWTQSRRNSDRMIGGFGRFDVAVKALPDLTSNEVGLSPDLVNAGETETFVFSFDCSGTCDAGDFEVENDSDKAAAAKFINGGGPPLARSDSAWGASGASAP